MSDESGLLCSICRQAIDLKIEKHPDQDGKPMHEMCHIKKIIAAGPKPLPPEISKLL